MPCVSPYPVALIASTSSGSSSRSQLITCRIGPNVSRLSAPSPSIPPRSISVGATKVPAAVSGASGNSTTWRPAARISAMCARSGARASASMTGPTSVANRRGSPTASSRIAPSSIATMPGATSFCMHRIRSAEQRWPALSNAELNASATTCSGSAELSTIIAFMPPVSAISTGSSSRLASSR